MALMNLKALMKQRTIGDSEPPPFAPAGTQGLLNKKFGAPRPSQSTEVQKMPNLMKRLTGK